MRSQRVCDDYHTAQVDRLNGALSTLRYGWCRGLAYVGRSVHVFHMGGAAGQCCQEVVGVIKG